MAFLINDQVKTLRMKEKNGVIVSLDREANIGGLGSSIDHTVLLRAYADVRLPVPGSFLDIPALSPVTDTAPGAMQGTAMLVLAEREFGLIDQDKASVSVVMHYQHFMEGGNQSLGGNPTNNSSLSPNGWYTPFSRAVYGKSRSSVQQTKSNFTNSRLQALAWDPFGTYPLGSIVDYNGTFWVAVVPVSWTGFPAPALPPPPGPAGTLIGEIWGLQPEDLMVPTLAAPGRRRQIVVGHQFPATDTQYPSQTKYQTGEITIMQPNDNFKLHGQVFIRNPRTIKRALVGAINSVPWMDGAAYEWMCTEVGSDPMYVRWQHMMTFEFQRNPDGWRPTAIFNDQRIGRPPANTVDGFGRKTVHAQAEVDFEAYFNQVLGTAPSAGS